MGDAATPVLPDFTSQTASAYKANIDAGFAVADRVAWAFAPHEQSTPDMTVRLEKSYILDGVTLTEVAAQSTGTITAPTTNPRIDRVVIDETTGALSVVTGTEAPSPSAPAIPSGKLPNAQVLLQTSTTTITNSIITDERIAIFKKAPAALTASSGVKIVSDDIQSDILGMTGAAVIASDKMPFGDVSAGGSRNVAITQFYINTAANKAQMEAGTANTAPVIPKLQHNHPGHPKAWVSFNGTGTVAIRDDYNVSSITDNGTGDYTVNFTTGFSSADYGFSVSAGRGAAVAQVILSDGPFTADPTTGAFRLQTMDSNRAVIDCEFVSATFYGDQ